MVTWARAHAWLNGPVAAWCAGRPLGAPVGEQPAMAWRGLVPGTAVHGRRTGMSQPLGVGRCCAAETGGLMHRARRPR